MATRRRDGRCPYRTHTHDVAEIDGGRWPRAHARMRNKTSDSGWQREPSGALDDEQLRRNSSCSRDCNHPPRPPFTLWTPVSRNRDYIHTHRVPIKINHIFYLPKQVTFSLCLSLSSRIVQKKLLNRFGGNVVQRSRMNPLDLGGDWAQVTLGFGQCLRFHVVPGRTVLRLLEGLKHWVGFYSEFV